MEKHRQLPPSVCAECSKHFKQGSSSDFCNKCQSKRARTPQLICSGCTTEIVGRHRRLHDGRAFHRECLRCVLCRVPIDKNYEIRRDSGQPVCSGSCTARVIVAPVRISSRILPTPATTDTPATSIPTSKSRPIVHVARSVQSLKSSFGFSSRSSHMSDEQCMSPPKSENSLKLSLSSLSPSPSFLSTSSSSISVPPSFSLGTSPHYIPRTPSESDYFLPKSHTACLKNNTTLYKSTDSRRFSDGIASSENMFRMDFQRLSMEEGHRRTRSAPRQELPKISSMVQQLDALLMMTPTE